MEEKIVFENSKGQKLVGILYGPKDKIVIFCHGYRSDKNSSKAKRLSELLLPKGIGLFVFDMSGRGESEGRFEDSTVTQYIDDLKCAIDCISKFSDKIGVIGSSLGGLVSLQEAVKENRIKVLVEISPVSRFPYEKTGDYSQENIKKWKKQGYIFTESKRFGKMRINYSFYEDLLKYDDHGVYNDIAVPVLIVHGTADASVPIEQSKELVKHIKNSKLIKIEGADHKYSKEKDFNRMINETCNFIAGFLK